MKVRLKRAITNYADLTPGNIYRVLGIEANDLRIMNDFGRPYLYPPELFTVVDASEPRQWRTVFGKEGERYAYPPQFKRPGFFEDYFDGVRSAVSQVQQYFDGLSRTQRRSPKRPQQRAG